jgi:FtsH-binding integral membrane protein
MIEVLIVIPLLVAVIIYLVSFKDGKQVCDNYILSSYLYALFYITLTAYLSFIIFLQYPHLFAFFSKQNISIYGYIAISIVIALLYLGLYVTVLILPKRYVITKHLLSLIVILLGSLIISTVFITFAPDALGIALIMTVVLFVIMTIIAWKFQKYISSKIPLLVFIVFIILVVIEFILLMFFPNSIITTIVICIVLIMLCYILLVKTKKMIENSKSCDIPDYVSEGLRLLLSFQNIFLQILQLRGRGR